MTKLKGRFFMQHPLLLYLLYLKEELHIWNVVVILLLANSGVIRLVRHICCWKVEISSCLVSLIKWICQSSLLACVFLNPYLYSYSLLQLSFSSYCQTPTLGQTWELTLLSPGNKNRNKKNDPHPNSPIRGLIRVMKFCMWPSVTKIIRLHP